jgi:hypothetical protein
VTARAQSAIYITTTALGLQCVYNLFVKYRYVLHNYALGGVLAAEDGDASTI